MKLAYYPGCTLKTTDRSFETSTLASAEVLGIGLVEPDRWNCCGTVHALAKDDVMHHLAPLRNLLRVEEMKAAGQVDETRVVTLCAMCYNTLKRSNAAFAEKPDLASKVAENFNNEVSSYGGSVKVEHLLETLREYGWKNVKAKVKKPLTGLKVAPYYGCLLLRPRGTGVDDADKPTVMEDLFRALGAEVVDFPSKLKCCGSYHTIHSGDAVAGLAVRILTQAREAGADLVATGCPLCDYNLGTRQTELKKTQRGFTGIPVVYFTQLLGLALGVGEDRLNLGESKPDPRPLLAAKGLLKEN